MEMIGYTEQNSKDLLVLASIEKTISDLYYSMERAELLYGRNSKEYQELLEKLEAEFFSEDYFENIIPISLLTREDVKRYFSFLGCSRIVEKIKNNKKYELENLRVLSKEQKEEIMAFAKIKLGVDFGAFSESKISSIVSNIIEEYGNELDVKYFFLWLAENNRLNILQKEIDNAEDESYRRDLIRLKYSLLQNSDMAEQVNFNLLSESERKSMDPDVLAKKNGCDSDTILSMKREYFKGVSQDIIEGLLEDLTPDRNVDLLSEINLRANALELSESELGELKFFVDLVVPSESQMKKDLQNIFDKSKDDKLSISKSIVKRY